MVLILPNSKSKISFDNLLTWLEQLPEEQKQAIAARFRFNDLKNLQNRMQKVVQAIPENDISEEEILTEIKTYRNGQ
jgi:hypothetical protein